MNVVPTLVLPTVHVWTIRARIPVYVILDMNITQLEIHVMVSHPDSVVRFEPPREKTNNLHMRKQRRRSASR